MGIETSCDETSIAIIDNNNNIYCNITYSQSYLYKKFGGIIPEICYRNHTEILPYLIENILIKKKIKLFNIKTISITGGPGMINSLMISLSCGNTLANILNKNIKLVNHIEAHIKIANMIFNIKYPFISIVISGGHSQIFLINKKNKYCIIKTTIDDSLGEVFDKLSKMLNLKYPGGPIIEKYARHGNNLSFSTKHIINIKNNFSFSGIKTEIKNNINVMMKISQKDKSDICYMFQKEVTIIINQFIIETILILKKKYKIIRDIIISGGVASNKYIYKKTNIKMSKIGYNVYAPPVSLCTDNALMIAYLSKYKNNTKII